MIKTQPQIGSTDLLGYPQTMRHAKFGGKSALCRFTLERYWSASGRVATVIGCNPSTADAFSDDPTTKWWSRWFRNAGFSGFVAVNLYPFCSPSPAECRRLADWESRRDWYARDDIQTNISVVESYAKQADQVFACWGAIAWDPGHIEYVVEEIQSNEEPWPAIWCWGRTKHGAPIHPMARGKHRVAPDQKPILWRAP